MFFIPQKLRNPLLGFNFYFDTTTFMDPSL